MQKKPTSAVRCHVFCIMLLQVVQAVLQWSLLNSNRVNTTVNLLLFKYAAHTPSPRGFAACMAKPVQLCKPCKPRKQRRNWSQISHNIQMLSSVQEQGSWSMQDPPLLSGAVICMLLLQVVQTICYVAGVLSSSVGALGSQTWWVCGNILWLASGGKGFYRSVAAAA